MNITIPEQIFCYQSKDTRTSLGYQVFIEKNRVFMTDTKTLLSVEIENEIEKTLALDFKGLKSAKTKLKIKGDLTFNLLSVERPYADIEINDKKFIILEGAHTIPNAEPLFKEARAFEIPLSQEFLEIFKLYGYKDFICKDNLLSVKIGKDTILTQEVKVKDFEICFSVDNMVLDTEKPFIFSLNEKEYMGILKQGNTEFYMMSIIK